jgi:uncharacterized protein DUF3309
VIVLIGLIALAMIMVVAAVPVWPYNRHCGYGTSGGFGLLALIMTALLLAARS